MLYGKEWKKIQPLVRTRSLIQVRTHAQKVFKNIVDKNDFTRRFARKEKELKTGRGSTAETSGSAASSANSSDEEDSAETKKTKCSSRGHNDYLFTTYRVSIYIVNTCFFYMIGAAHTHTHSHEDQITALASSEDVELLLPTLPRDALEQTSATCSNSAFNISTEHSTIHNVEETNKSTLRDLLTRHTRALNSLNTEATGKVELRNPFLDFSMIGVSSIVAAADEIDDDELRSNDEEPCADRV